MVLCGDFYQLPPIHVDQRGGTTFAFNARCWKPLVTQTFMLTQVYRQNDQQFVALLDEVRHGVYA